MVVVVARVSSSSSSCSSSSSWRRKRGREKKKSRRAQKRDTTVVYKRKAAAASRPSVAAQITQAPGGGWVTGFNRDPRLAPAQDQKGSKGPRSGQSQPRICCVSLLWPAAQSGKPGNSRCYRPVQPCIVAFTIHHTPRLRSNHTDHTGLLPYRNSASFTHLRSRWLFWLLWLLL